MSGPDIQRDVGSRRLFAAHNDLGELLTLFCFQLRFAKLSRTPGINEEVNILQAYVSGARAAGSTFSLSSPRDEQRTTSDVHPS
jgi:hypothetical protein